MMRGVLQGHKVSVLIDRGASHNFIDSALLKRRHIPTVDFEGFRVEVLGGRTMPCDKHILGMKLTLQRHCDKHNNNNNNNNNNNKYSNCNNN
jgi:hypothetical protein